MKQLILLVAFVWVVRPIPNNPTEIRKVCDWWQYDWQRQCWYIDSSGTMVYYPDVRAFNVMGRWTKSSDETVGSLEVFEGL